MQAIDYLMSTLNSTIGYYRFHFRDDEQDNRQLMLCGVACSLIILGFAIDRCRNRRRIQGNRFVMALTPPPTAATTRFVQPVVDHVYSTEVAQAVKTIHDVAYQSLNCCNPHQFKAQQLALLLVVHARVPNIELANKLLQQAILESPKEQIPSQQAVSSTEPQENYPSWATVMRIDPETVLTVTHGGGVTFLKAFLAGENQGYASEAGGRGIFVTPEHPDLDLAAQQAQAERYACVTPIKYHDTPGIMTGKIRAKHLKKVNRNAYAVVILPEQRNEFLEVAIRDLSEQMRSFEFRKKYCEKWIPIAVVLDELKTQHGYSDGEVGQMKQYWAEFMDQNPDDYMINFRNPRGNSV